MDHPRMNIIRSTSMRSVDSTIRPPSRKLMGCSHADRHFVLGFPNANHCSRVRNSVDLACPNIRVHPNHPRDITEEVKKLVDPYSPPSKFPIKSMWLDTGCIFDFAKVPERERSSLRRLIEMADAAEVIDDWMDTSQFVQICLGGVLGLAIPIDLEYEDERSIVFWGQLIYGKRLNPEFMVLT